MLRDLLCDLGCLGSHGLSRAQPSLSSAQPFSQWLQRFMELKSQNLQFLQLPLPRRQKEGVLFQHLHQDMVDRQRRAFASCILLLLSDHSMTLMLISVSFFLKNKHFLFSLEGYLGPVENYRAPALSSKSAHLSASF